VAAGEGGLEIWDVSTPEAPLRLSRFEVECFEVEVPVGDVCVRGNFAYVSTSFGFVHWIDVSDPTQPVDNGFNGFVGRTNGLAISGSFLYVAAADFGKYFIRADGSLQSLDSNTNFSSAGSVSVSGNYAYVTSNGDLFVLAINQPFLPIVGSFAASNARSSFAVGDRVYLADVPVG
jgi:hypothetical protein